MTSPPKYFHAFIIMPPMTEALIEMGVEAAPLVVLASCLVGLNRSAVKPPWLLITLILVVLHEILLTRILWQFSAAWDGPWNWSGKLLALAGGLAIAALPCFGFRRSGIILMQAPGSGPAWLLAVLLCLFYLGQAIVYADGPADAETILFMWTMPGTEEEVFYRGILLLALNEAFTARRRVFGADMGWGALLTAISFGAVHGLSSRDGQPHLDLLYFASTFVSGLFLVWLRERTGSILAPVLCHSVRDGVFKLF